MKQILEQFILKINGFECLCIFNGVSAEILIIKKHHNYIITINIIEYKQSINPKFSLR